MTTTALLLLTLSIPVVVQTEVRPSQIHTRQIQPSGPQSLGSEVLLLGDTTITSAHLDSRVLEAGGSLDLLRRGSDGWSYVAPIYQVQPSLAEQLGRDSLAATSELIAAGAYRHNLVGAFVPPYGRVHLFRRSGESFETEATLFAPDALAPFIGTFGLSVAIVSDDEVLVGGTRAGGPAADGAVYVFRRDSSGTWTSAQKLEPTGSLSGIRIGLGRQMCTASDHVIGVGDWTSGRTEQHVYVLARDSLGTWSIAETAAFDVASFTSVISDIDANEHFVVVGDSSAQCGAGAARPGRVHVFRRTPSGLSRIQTLFARDPFVSTNNTNGCPISDQFGYSVALDGNRLVVGAGNALVDQGFDGAAEVFEFNGTEFERTHLLRLDDPAATYKFGCAVDIDGDTVAVGMKNYSDGPAGILWPGGVAFFDLPRGTTECPGQINTTGGAADLTMHGTASLAIGDVHGRVVGLPVGATCLPLVGSAASNVPGAGGSQGTLCLGGQLGRFDGEVGFADADGRFSFDVDASALPLSAGIRAIAAGETWRFQVWYRDTTPGGLPGSNFSSAVAADFVD